jgi:hypothetical protein
VRISDIARSPAEFLLAPKAKDNRKHTPDLIDRAVDRMYK